MSLIRRVKPVFLRSASDHEGKAFTLILSVNSDKLKKLFPRLTCCFCVVVLNSLKDRCTRARYYSVSLFIED